MTSQIVVFTAHRAIGIIEEAGIECVLFGGLALPAWGRLRGTLDVDLLLQCDRDSLASLGRRLSDAGFRLRSKEPAEFNDYWLIQAFRGEPARGVEVRVDLFAGRTAFHSEVMRRRVLVSFGGRPVHIPSCEDLLLLKLVSARPLDLADARELYHGNRETLDSSHLEEWADRLGIASTLQAIQTSRLPL